MNRRWLAGMAVSLALLAGPAVSAPSPEQPVASVHIGQGTVQERTFHSAALQRDMHYVAILPVGYEKSSRRYPVLYLLHGYSGDYKDWVTRTRLADDARRYPMIIVTPDAQNSWYVNSATTSQDRFEDYVVSDLIGDVDAHWRTLTSPGRRAIAGLSMGGYGAVLLSLKHPGLFSVAAGLSGAYEGPVGIEKIMPVLQESLTHAYGPEESPTRAENDVYSLFTRGVTPLPYLYLACGSQDPLLASNHRLIDLLAAKKVPFEYHEYPGGHDWDFWNARLPAVLDVVDHAFGPPLR